ncbi:MAG: hypothetical protein ACI4KM_01995, partial [Oscillospiraceae bacterium]
SGRGISLLKFSFFSSLIFIVVPFCLRVALLSLLYFILPHLRGNYKGYWFFVMHLFWDEKRGRITITAWCS